MQRILINGLNAKAAGGKSVLTNFLIALGEFNCSEEYCVLVPEGHGYLSLGTEKINIVEFPRVWSRSIYYPIINSIVLPRYIRKHGCAAVLNFSDIPVPASAKQIFLFDWPYAAFPESVVWKQLGASDWVSRKLKLLLFKRYLGYVDRFVVQSAVMEKRMGRLFGLKSISVVPNAVSLKFPQKSAVKTYTLPSRKNFLCLTHYYPHKNVEILIELAEKIREKNLDIGVVLTLDSDQSEGARKFLRRIKLQGLEDILLNIGSVPMNAIPALYEQTDGLLLPTLLESFSGTYVEAMHFRKPILTSNLDFATGVCGEAAYYFDPHSATDILNSILICINDEDERNKKIEIGLEILESQLNWKQATAKYIDLIREELR